MQQEFRAQDGVDQTYEKRAWINDQQAVPNPMASFRGSPVHDRVATITGTFIDVPLCPTWHDTCIFELTFANPIALHPFQWIVLWILWAPIVFTNLPNPSTNNSIIFNWTYRLSSSSFLLWHRLLSDLRPSSHFLLTSFYYPFLSLYLSLFLFSFVSSASFFLFFSFIYSSISPTFFLWRLQKLPLCLMLFLIMFMLNDLISPPCCLCT